MSEPYRGLIHWCNDRRSYQHLRYTATRTHTTLIFMRNHMYWHSYVHALPLHTHIHTYTHTPHIHILGMPYLDVIRRLRDASNLPIAAYQVSGEYAMLKAAAQKVRTYKYKHTYVLTYTHTCTQTHTHTHILTHAITYIRKYMHTHTCTRTQAHCLLYLAWQPLIHPSTSFTCRAG